jgi:hypothetical protein
MRTTLTRTALLLVTVLALMVPAAAQAQYRDRYRGDRYRYDQRADWVAADLEKMARQVHRQAEDYYRNDRGERQVVLTLHALEDAARAFNRSGGDEWAFERLADAYYRAADALSRVRYRSHVYGGFNRIDELMNELFDRYGYRSRGNARRDDRRFRDRPRDRWRH